MFQKGNVSNMSQNNAANLSGSKWWHANQNRYPNSRSVDDLDGDFRDKVKTFINALKEGGATINISSTRRNKIRAHLMHYSWKVSQGDIAPKEVPKIKGLNIEWDHGDLKESRRAASEMVELFNMAHIASLTSNHISGKAIDMTIKWNEDLTILVPGHANPDVISTGPRNGDKNRELHRLGSEFGVNKLLNDPPHWSHNGK
jgi:hypothetical protein